DDRSCRSLYLLAAPFDRVQGRVLVQRAGLGAFGSDRSDDRAGVYGLGVVSHRMTSSIFVASSPRRRHERRRPSAPSTARTAIVSRRRQPCCIARSRIGRNTTSAMTAAIMLRIAAT